MAWLSLLLVLQMDATGWSSRGGCNQLFTIDASASSLAEYGFANSAWIVDAASTNAGVVVSENVVILLERVGEDERIRGLQLQSGKQLWSYSYPAPLPEFFDAEFGLGPHSTPAIHDGIAYCVGVTGMLHALSVETGNLAFKRQLWAGEFTQLERGFGASPLVINDLVILPVGGKGSSVIALDCKNGRLVWASGDWDAAYSSPISMRVGEGQHVVVVMESAVAAFDADSGRVQWSFPFKTLNSVHVASPIAIGQSSVIVASSAGSQRLKVYQEVDGTYRVRSVWESKRLSPQVGNLINYDGKIIGPTSGSSSKLTSCISADDGKLLWRKRFGGRGGYFSLSDGIATYNDYGDFEVQKWARGDVTSVLKIERLASRPAWSVPAFDEGFAIFHTGEKVVAYRFD